MAVNRSSCADAAYNCAVTVTEVFKMQFCDVARNRAAMEVMVPPRGRGSAKIDGSDRQFVPDATTPGAVKPKPTNPRVWGVPDAPVVKMTGEPDENGRMAEEPAGPIGPVGPTGPMEPVGPVGPIGPVSPVKP